MHGLSGTVGGSPQRGGCQVIASSGPLGPGFQVSGVFSNKDLPSTSGALKSLLANYSSVLLLSGILFFLKCYFSF